MAVSVLLVVYPFVGMGAYGWQQISLQLREPLPSLESDPKTSPASEALTDALALATGFRATPAMPVSAPDARPKENLLVIPKIGVNMKIVDGLDGKSALRNGAWHIPGTSTPDRGGNMVLGGHRYLFRPPSSKTFYNLDKLAVGDTVNLSWQGTVHTYVVRESKVVAPSAVSILSDTKDDILTLFTCTPLFSSKQRLVVIAEKM